MSWKWTNRAKVYLKKKKID